jgi:SAM-dependent methyltransferase
VGSELSNSFNFVPLRDVSRRRGESCPLARDGVALATAVDGVAPERSLFLVLADRMRLCRTTTRDFSDVEIARVKDSGQLYADVSSKLAPDDFSVDLRKLLLASDCARCSALGTCPGAYRATTRDVFRCDDERTLELLASLEGRVLDVGAGHAPYVAELEAAVTAGRASYLAIDPDGAALELLRSRVAWAETRAGTLEVLIDEAVCFDHVLFLRSVNHLPDVDAALEAACRLLRDGGSLVLVDDVPFGLVRDGDHAERAESGPATFEHHRREDAEAVHRRCARLPLVLVERRDVEPGGSNQWLLRYEKRGDG